MVKMDRVGFEPTTSAAWQLSKTVIYLLSKENRQQIHSPILHVKIINKSK